VKRDLREVVPPTGLAWCQACGAAVDRLYYDQTKVSSFRDAVTGKRYEFAPALICGRCAHIPVDTVGKRA